MGNGKAGIVCCVVTSILSLTVQAQSTDIQRLLVPKGVSQSQLIEKNSLIRLWPLTSVSSSNGTLNIQDSVSGRYSALGGSSIFSTGKNVSAIKCGDRNFAYFNKGSIVSDETGLLENVLKDVRHSMVQTQMLEIKRKQVFAALKAPQKLGINIPNTVDPYGFRHTSDIVNSISKSENQSAIYRSTSMMKIEKNQQGQLEVENADYSLGGWFKPEYSSKSDEAILFRKYFEGSGGKEAQDEWTLMVHGGTLYFHYNRDFEAPTRDKYLSEEEIKQFKGRNAHFYGPDDYYMDVIEKQNIQRANQMPVGSRPLVKILVASPVAHKSSKPVPAPGNPPIVVVPGLPSPTEPLPPVVVNPPPIPVPNSEVPRPPYPLNPPIYGYYAPATGKDHPFSLTMPLGGCYGCVQPGVHSEAWHFFAISVRQSDPLGPYMDLYVIRDPNEKQFGKKAKLANHFIHRRIEIPRESGMSSRLIYNPVTHGYITERTCSSGLPCTSSKFQIGGSPVFGQGSVTENGGGKNDGSRTYTGFMRGIFFSKKALYQANIIEMASEFSPMDDQFCTFVNRPPAP